MNPTRRRGLQWLGLQGLGAGLGLLVPGTRALMAQTLGSAQTPEASVSPPPLRPEDPLVFPRDHGAHPAYRTEWWYLTGALRAEPVGRTASSPPTRQPYTLAEAPTHGFQITFFRSRVDAARDSRSAFAARQLIFAHAALTDLRDPRRARLLHDERIARAGLGLAEAAEGDTRVHIGPQSAAQAAAPPTRTWQLQRQGPSGRSVYEGRLRAQGFGLDLRLAQTQPLLLQGQAGFSQKAPGTEHASRYYSLPHLAVSGRIQQGDDTLAVTGTAWLDHEWSEALLHPEAEGWDWMGINLLDGGALTAFRLRRPDGSALWHGGSLRRPGQPDRSFGPDELRLTPGRRWTSPATGARYPVEWTVEWPEGHGAQRRLQRHTLRASLDAQELDSRGSTGNVYWEGLSELRDAQGQLAGRGYLEMTGYTARLAL